MDDLQQNAIRIKESIHLHLKYALGLVTKFKRNYVFDSHKNSWKRLQWDDNIKMHWKIGLKNNRHI